MKIIVRETLAGDRWDMVLEAAITAAAREEAEAVFDFNGVEVHVRGDSDAALITRDWGRALRGCISGPIGPYPATQLSSEEIERDRAIDMEREARQQAREEEWAAEALRLRADLDAALAAVTPLRLKDSEAWRKTVAANDDPYGRAAVQFAEDWACLMQAEMDAGAALETCAEECERLPARVHGLTGFQYGCAVSLLSQCWKHGEELRCWHNLKTQIRDEGERANENGGVLTPALLSMS